MSSTDAEKRARFHALKAELHDLGAEDRAARKESRRLYRKATKAARAERPMSNQRTPRVREPLYLAFLRRKPCLACGKTPSDAAHIRFVPGGSGWRHVGMMEKPDDFRAVPLCRKDHTIQHSMSEEKYWRGILRLDPVAEVNRLRGEYLGNPND
jgi:hypothetical protein